MAHGEKSRAKVLVHQKTSTTTEGCLLGVDGKPLLIQDLQLPHLRLTTLSLESNHHFIKGELLGCLVMGAKFGNCCVHELPNFEKTIIPRCTA